METVETTQEAVSAHSNCVISFDKVVKLYPNGVNALRGVSFKIERGEFVFLMGASGAGKSTMLKILLKEEEPSGGLAMVDGKNLKKVRGYKIPKYRRNIGIVFQDFRLLEKKTVFDNIAFAMEITGASRGMIRRQVETALSLVGLSHKANEFPAHLSGGEQQRVAVARALVNAPQIIIADEPTGNLDPENSSEVMHLLEEINRHGITVLVATHERRLAEQMDKRVIYLENGRLKEYEYGKGKGKMNKVRIFLYIVKQGLQNIVKNGFMIFASVSVIFVSLFILGALFLISYNIESTLTELSDGPSVTVNCENTLSNDDSESIYKTILLDDRVLAVKKITKEENFERMIAVFEGDKKLFEDYTADDLFVSFEVELKDVTQGEAFVKTMEETVGVNSVKNTVKVLQFFTTLKKWVSIGTVVTVIGLGILSFLLTANTIKLTVVARKSELEIMKYVGATNSYIRGPFIIEGLFIGTLGAVLAYFLLKLVYGFVENYVNGTESVNSMIRLVSYSQFGNTILLYFMGAAVFIGILGSVVAIRKHLKV